MHEIQRLLDIMAQLRDAERGCPWDLEQTFDSVVPFTIEEAYEVAEAVASGNRDELKDELGDLLLQVVFHAQMAAEENVFDFTDVIDCICAKMIRRHPHVFGDTQSMNTTEQRAAWEQIKATERRGKLSDNTTETSALAGVALALPGLSRAVKLQHKAAQVGFDWQTRAPVVAKVREELGELLNALDDRQQQADAVCDQAVFEEMGDLLFACANLARHLNIDPETAIRHCNGKFERRFGFIERTLWAENIRLEDTTLDTLEALWQRAKIAEKHSET